MLWQGVTLLDRKDVTLAFALSHQSLSCIGGSRMANPFAINFRIHLWGRWS